MPFLLQEAGCPSTNGKPALLEAFGMTSVTQATVIPPNNTSASFLTLTEVFRGQHCSSVKCLECKRESPKDDFFTQLEAYQAE